MEDVVQVITVEELRTKLSSLRGSTAIAIQTETIPELLKKDRITKEPCPYEDGDISKIGIMGGLIGCSYENSVNNQLGREDKNLDFNAQERKWGTLSSNKVLVHHVNKKGQEKYYLQILVKSSEKPIYLWGNSEIDVEELRPYLPVSNTPKTQDELEKKITLRDVDLANIKRIKLLGELYVIGSPNDLPSVEAVKEQTDNFVERIVNRLAFIVTHIS